MNNSKIFVSLIVLSCIVIVSSIPESEAKLWDMIIDVKFLHDSIEQGKNPIIMGTVVDHAYNPISRVDVKVTFAGQSFMLETDGSGEFGKQLDGSQLKPRTYSANVFATTEDGKKGMARTTLNVEGHTEKSARFDIQLENLEMANNISKLRNNPNDPISNILYEHYLELQENAINEKHIEASLDLPQKKIREARVMVYESLVNELEKRPLITKQFYDSPKLIKFLYGLDDNTQTIFELQLNSTKIRFFEGQNIMNEILENGGTMKDARHAYLEHISISQNEMQELIEKIQKSKNSPHPLSNSTEN
tara:strand:- start:260 stop:1174 length:915 start_codon:yes stop_codon:yes gene_type:complete